MGTDEYALEQECDFLRNQNHYLSEQLHQFKRDCESLRMELKGMKGFVDGIKFAIEAQREAPRA